LFWDCLAADFVRRLDDLDANDDAGALRDRVDVALVGCVDRKYCAHCMDFASSLVVFRSSVSMATCYKLVYIEKLLQKKKLLPRGQAAGICSRGCAGVPRPVEKNTKGASPSSMMTSSCTN
jgi:hypothetical protein